MISCRELARLQASGELAHQPFLQRLSARFHLWMCKPCRQYGDQIRELGKVVRDGVREASSDGPCKESIIQACLCPERRAEACKGLEIERAEGESPATVAAARPKNS